MLDISESYLWKQKSSVMGPQFRAIKESEQQGSGALTNSSHASLFLTKLNGNPGKPDDAPRYNLNFDYSLSVPRFYEETAGHWGIETTKLR